jgi:F-type H+-transporting ATPase subunit b
MSILASVVLRAEEVCNPAESNKCFQAPQKWFPGEEIFSYELIWGGLAFLIVFGVLFWKAGPAIKKGMAARTERIQAELDKSAAAKVAAEQEANEVRASLAGASDEAAAIVSDARRTAEQLKAEGLARVEAELVDTRARALADLESSKGRVSSELQGAVARLAIGAAEQVVERNLDAATQSALVEQFIAQVGSVRS